MKKGFIILLTALLLCGLFACSNGDPAEIGTATSEPTDAPAFSTENARPLSFSEDRNIEWNADFQYRVLIYSDGKAVLRLPNALLWLKENGDTVSVEERLYRSPYDSEPMIVLPVGTIRLLSDGEALKIETVDDPLGIFAFSQLDGQILKKEEYKPGSSKGNWNWFNLPIQPGTEWVTYLDTGERIYASLTMQMHEDGSTDGVLRFPDGTEKSCMLAGNADSFALIDESTESPELFFYGIRTPMEEYNSSRYNLVRLALDPFYDPLGLCRNDTFLLHRNSGKDAELRYMLGKNRDTVILSLIRDGWTDKTQQVAELDPWLDGWFAWLTKNGQTLLMWIDLDYSSPYNVYEAFAADYVLYDTDGAVLSWSGEKPLDHTIADHYTLQEGVYFNGLPGVYGGMVIREDSAAYFLDDGRIAIQTIPHEGGNGDDDFFIVRVIP